MNPTSKAPTMFQSLRVFGSALLLAVSFAVVPATAAAQAAKAFPTPDALFQAMADAVAAHDQKALDQIFGAAGKRIVNTGDPVRDKNASERFSAAWAQKHTVTMKDDARAELVVGNDDWPFPIPAVKTAAGWSLDSAAGAHEIIARRIGENELAAIAVVRAIADAEQDYAGVPRNGKYTQYAQKLVSSPGHKDGLYWKSAAGEPDSPLGALAARASAEGRTEGQPYHGYRFHILTAQGKGAKGGARNYVVGGRMIGGFGIVAYPSQYQDTGIMTFIVNQDGIVYEKDLGVSTEKVAPKMKLFDPDPTWKAVQ